MIEWRLIDPFTFCVAALAQLRWFEADVIIPYSNSHNNSSLQLTGLCYIISYDKKKSICHVLANVVYKLVLSIVKTSTIQLNEQRKWKATFTHSLLIFSNKTLPLYAERNQSTWPIQPRSSCKFLYGQYLGLSLIFIEFNCWISQHSRGHWCCTLLCIYEYLHHANLNIWILKEIKMCLADVPIYHNYTVVTKA